MELPKIAAILMLVLQLLNGAVAAFGTLIPLKVSAIIMFVIGIIQSVLPRIQPKPTA